MTSELLKNCDNDEHDQAIIESITIRMETILYSSESKLIKQGEQPTQHDKNDVMFFLARGKCKVTIRDKFQTGYESYKVKNIVEGMNFGEIGMVFGCPRSATVESVNYITCSTINR